jgi:hypothetical protein
MRPTLCYASIWCISRLGPVARTCSGDAHMCCRRAHLWCFMVPSSRTGRTPRPAMRNSIKRYAGKMPNGEFAISAKSPKPGKQAASRLRTLSPCRPTISALSSDKRRRHPRVKALPGAFPKLVEGAPFAFRRPSRTARPFGDGRLLRLPLRRA